MLPYLEQAHRAILENNSHRHERMGTQAMINPRWYYFCPDTTMSGASPDVLINTGVAGGRSLWILLATSDALSELDLVQIA